MKKRYIAFLASIFIACNSNTAPAKNVVAKVYEFVLTKEELKQNVPTTTSIVDSLKVTQQYIQRWAKQKLLYRNALINLDNTEELDQMIDKYKEELYVSYYKNALVNKKLDTLVFKSEIDSFYVHNQANFKLNEVLVKFKYIHLDAESKNRYEIKKLFQSNDFEDKQKLLSDYSNYDDYYFNDSTWIALKGVYSNRPDFPVLSNYQLTRQNGLIEIRVADRSIYYIYIKDVLNEGDVAPIEYIEPTIKNILLHKNKIQFFNQMEQILIEDAVKQQKYEVH
ncbi:hypothetical protein [Wenyingzhuangia sp. 2_MG-2023]|uniref:hypothetical protein n=1 Tax=Wenyingzhuangia sp. 2_MG-2023 TaxID=3062639 RepID=UPI0026E29AA7|nr:hypothetical protein [Wenyingzhuangia sp. 2_MG-2023]MDO6738398.1 hypothetical protein [Wenyingzhuangia sp. 2_MG-2023]